MAEEPQKTEQEIKLEQTFKDIRHLLWTEIKKDLPFFGSCGFIAISFFLVEAFFEQWFPSRDAGSLADEPFFGFILLGVYGPLIAGFMIIGLITNILYCFKQQYAWLNNMYVCFNNMVKHVEHRLRQFISVTITFAAGVISFALLHALVTVTSTGIILAILTFSLMVFIYIFFMLAHIITRRIELYKNIQIWDKWWSSALFLALVIVVLLLILIEHRLYGFLFLLVFFLPLFSSNYLWNEKRHINKAP